MRNRFVGLSFCLLVVLLTGCESGPGKKQVKAPPPKPEKAPSVYKVRFETTKGDFILEVHHDWAPRGADHFFELVRNRFYDGDRFFRVVRGYIVQFGINGNPKIQSLWGRMRIRDDPVKKSNKRGYVSFAKLGPNSRTSQVFINLSNNTELDKQGFAPFGVVRVGMDVIGRFWSSYGEVAPRGSGPDPTKIELEGNIYLDRKFPRLDSIIKAVVVHEPRPKPAGAGGGPS